MQTTNDPLYTPLTEELSHENLQIAGDTSLIERRHRDEPEATSTAISMSSGEVYEGKDFVKTGNTVNETAKPAELVGPCVQDADESIDIAYLSRLALSEVNFYATQALQLRNDHTYLHQRIKQAAIYRPELCPDAAGNAPTVDDLLSRPEFVAKLSRYLIHNTFLYTSEWKTIAEYLADVARLDDNPPALGYQFDRYQLMQCAKFMVGQAIEHVERQMKIGVRMDPVLGRDHTREKTHPGYTGAVLSFEGFLEDHFDPAMPRTVEGLLIRLSVEHYIDDLYTVVDLRRDLRKQYRTESSKPNGLNLNEHLTECLSQWDRLMDFRAKLGYPNDHSFLDDNIPDDKRYKTFANSKALAEETLEKKCFIEKFITNIASLEKPNVFNKVWKEIEERFRKRTGGKVLEEVLGFAPVSPRFVPELTTRRPARSTPTKPVARRKWAPRVPSAQPRLELEPADVKPYWERPELAPILELPQRSGDKVKTKGAPTNSSPGAEALQVGTADEELAFEFHVPRKIYETCMFIFSRGQDKGQLKWRKFTKAMTALGFSLIPSTGSIVTFKAPPGCPGGEIPLTCHSPHPYVNILPHNLDRWAANMYRSYGMTKESFVLAGEDDDTDSEDESNEA